MLKVLACHQKQVIRDQVFPTISDAAKTLDGKRLDMFDITAQIRSRDEVDDLIKFLQITRQGFLEPAKEGPWKDHAR